MKLSEKQKHQFGELFLDRYLKRGFGSMSKSDFELLIFDILRVIDSGVHKSNYQWSIDLHIPETKVRKLAYEADLVYHEYDANVLIKKFFTLLEQNISKFSSDGKKIQFVVEDRSLRTMLYADLKELGYFADASHNGEIVSVELRAFSSLLMKYYPQEFAEQMEEKVKKSAMTIDKTAILQQFIEGIAKGTGETIPIGIKDLILGFTQPLELINKIFSFIKI